VPTIVDFSAGPNCTTPIEELKLYVDGTLVVETKEFRESGIWYPQLSGQWGAPQSPALTPLVRWHALV
jgi:hypothetical protein